MPSPKNDGLHRIHASPSQGNSCDIGGTRGYRVRLDGTDFGMKKAVTYRIALCWNLCEGWPTTALEDGVLRDVDEAAGHLIKTLGKEQLSPEGQAALTKLKELYAVRDAQLDMTDGRPADCDGCYPLKKKAAEAEPESPPEKLKPKKRRKPRNGELFADEDE